MFGGNIPPKCLGRDIPMIESSGARIRSSKTYATSNECICFTGNTAGSLSLFPSSVVMRIATPEMYGAGLYPEEALAVSYSVSGRRREFAAGRACARSVLSNLGVIPGPLPVRRDRSPAWPNGYLGSITHCPGFCCAAAASDREFSALGVDAETAGPLAPELVTLICRSDDIEHFSGLPPLKFSDWPKLTFSAKEAFYKAYRPLTGAFLDFLEVSIRFSVAPCSACGEFRVQINTPGKRFGRGQPAFEGRWMSSECLVLTGVHRSAIYGNTLC